jgi:hypothetical protein
VDFRSESPVVQNNWCRFSIRIPWTTAVDFRAEIHSDSPAVRMTSPGKIRLFPTFLVEISGQNQLEFEWLPGTPKSLQKGFYTSISRWTLKFHRNLISRGRACISCSENMFAGITITIFFTSHYTTRSKLGSEVIEKD